MVNILKEVYSKYPQLMCCEKQMVDAVDILMGTIKSDGIIYTCGNGGSASDSEHIVGELMKSFRIKRPLSKENKQKFKTMFSENNSRISSEKLIKNLEEGIRAVSLVSQMALSSAIYNDIGTDYVFAQQMYSYGRMGDTLIAISTSGNSQNCIYAAMAARARGAKVVGLTGKDGGQLADYCDVTINVPAKTTYEVQELHLPVYHALCGMVEEKMFSTASC